MPKHEYFQDVLDICINCKLRYCCIVDKTCLGFLPKNESLNITPPIYNKHNLCTTKYTTPNGKRYTMKSSGATASNCLLGITIIKDFSTKKTIWKKAEPRQISSEIEKILWKKAKHQQILSG